MFDARGGETEIFPGAQYGLILVGRHTMGSRSAMGPRSGGVGRGMVVRGG